MRVANKYLQSTFKIIEVFIVLLLIIAILVTGKEIILELFYEYHEGHLIENFKLILSEILLLAIGIEMAVLILKKNIYFVIDILILAIARKLIIYESSLDLLISIVGVMLLLAAKVYYYRNVLISDLERDKELERCAAKEQ